MAVLQGNIPSSVKRQTITSHSAALPWTPSQNPWKPQPLQEFRKFLRRLICKDLLVGRIFLGLFLSNIGCTLCPDVRNSVLWPPSLRHTLKRGLSEFHIVNFLPLPEAAKKTRSRMTRHVGSDHLLNNFARKQEVVTPAWKCSAASSGNFSGCIDGLLFLSSSSTRSYISSSHIFRNLLRKLLVLINFPKGHPILFNVQLYELPRDTRVSIEVMCLFAHSSSPIVKEIVFPISKRQEWTRSWGY